MPAGGDISWENAMSLHVGVATGGGNIKDRLAIIGQARRQQIDHAAKASCGY